MSEEFPIKEKIYLHRDKESNYDLADQYPQLDDDAAQHMKYMGYEVVVEVLINQNGRAYATSLNGVALERPVEI